MKRKGIVALIFFGICGAFVTGAFWFFQQRGQSSEQSSKLKEVTIQLKWEHQAQFAGIYVAKEKGLYEEQGLSVTIERGGPGAPPLPQVLSNKAEFGVAGADDVLVAVSEGKAIKAIAVIYQESPVAYFALKESGIKTPYDFVSKRVGVREGTGTYFTYIAMLNNLGIDRSKIIEVPAITTEISLLLEKKVDVLPGFRINEPKIANRMGYAVNIIKPEEYGVDIYADVLVTTQDIIYQKPELTRAFVKATLAGWEWAVQNREEAVDIVMKYASGTTREHQRDMLEETAELIKRSPTVKIGQMNFSKWNRTYSLLRQYDVIKNDFDIEQAYTTDFLK
ncbi:MAG: NMT1/THI5 like domain-containing protein [Parcubacteria group bacterium Gr01-1014_48]|nr:MAG: NMT1/THI5 like domain-containing protein [Parcubacteria group bacterium Greene0416_14]TSC73766.1 MAG: NMT1/THI5 like domain-containing protein [Parcubacteria group bacterium Gr01-1014_48]TSD01194.1 MAG: NMT1/THI5 like domain-containing protein [Parcubacteria group bacterium Greene1014_15]TSD08199.1 MAG: NMT1/THI5 like domain-containing protein [Parcubacteria group bacterium Greene0714_4]